MASIIDKTLAKSLIKLYREQNAAPGGPGLLAPEGQFLNGFFIDRNSLDSILANQDIVGISIHFAKHPDFIDSDQNVFTIVFAGAEHNPDFKKGNGQPPYVSRYETWDQVEPCPPVCAGLI
jgi:hypothetical protein